MFPVRCNGDTFKKKFFEKNIAAFQLVGYSVRRGGRGCQLGSGLLYRMASSSNGSGYYAFYVVIRVLPMYRGTGRLQKVRWCNG